MQTQPQSRMMWVMLTSIEMVSRRGKLLIPVLSWCTCTWQLGTSCIVQHLCRQCRSRSRISFLSFRNLNASDGKVVTWLLFEELYRIAWLTIFLGASGFLRGDLWWAIHRCSRFRCIYIAFSWCFLLDNEHQSRAPHLLSRKCQLDRALYAK